MTKVTRLTLDQGGGLENRRIHLREISGDADTPLETVGQDLRAARLRRGDDLATVSRSLKIRKDHLEALEEDNLEALPGRTYAIGFVRSYADYLGLDGVQCVERFKVEIAGRGGEPTVPNYTASYDERRLPHGWMIIGLVLLVAIVYGVYKLAMSADTLLAPVQPVPTRMMPKPQVTAARTPAPATTTPQTTPNPVGQAPAQPGTPAEGAAAVTAPNQQLASLPKGEIYGGQNSGSRMLLRMHEAARITVRGDDGTLYISRNLQPGDSYMVPNHTGLTLTTTNGGAVELQLDGQSLGYAGSAGQNTEDMSLDPQAVVDRTQGGHG
ncbi:MAG TPA: RodZ domain-containing protein [Rhizomicrobium sp.]|jgi:cytoskeleton protein RodZ|nr:RodZ domain-containing protein [Rhizomicrobium sp.]